MELVLGNYDVVDSIRVAAGVSPDNAVQCPTTGALDTEIYSALADGGPPTFGAHHGRVQSPFDLTPHAEQFGRLGLDDGGDQLDADLLTNSAAKHVPGSYGAGFAGALERNVDSRLPFLMAADAADVDEKQRRQLIRNKLKREERRRGRTYYVRLDSLHLPSDPAIQRMGEWLQGLRWLRTVGRKEKDAELVDEMETLAEMIQFAIERRSP